MTTEGTQRLLIGVLGRGPIAQAGHFDACRRARNAELWAICDVDEGIELLGQRTILAHGKDRDANGEVQPPGLGFVPWRRLLTGLQCAGFGGPLILHGLPESAVPASAAHLKEILRHLSI